MLPFRHRNKTVTAHRHELPGDSFPTTNDHNHIISPPEDMSSASRKFSYASVKEEAGDGLPQSFESSLSSQDLEEVEWIAWPCSQWCRTKGLCSYHFAGSHEDHVRTRLEGYARNNPRKLEKILDELEKRRAAQKLFNLPFAKEITQFHPHPASFSLEVWRERVRDSVRLCEGFDGALEGTAIADDTDESLSQVSREAPFSWLESMPEEVLELILSYVTVDHTADPYARPHVDLASCALVSRTIHGAAVKVLYRHVSMPQSRAFAKLMRTFKTAPQLGELVHWLDFSHYSNMGFGSARSTRNQTPFLKPETLKACLDLMPNLQAFLVHEHVDEELDSNIVSTLFNMPLMQALDFCACSSRPFAEAFTKVTTSLSSPLTSLKRLSLHECTTLQEPVFEALLPLLTNLTHLDVAHTLINDKALLSIPPTARITHLNLERCTHLTGAGVVRFLTTHPAVRENIVYLNLAADASRHRLLREDDVTALVASLPPSLRSLNLNGAKINPSHVPGVQKLGTHLEELGLRGANLSLGSDIIRLFRPSSSTSDDEPQGGDEHNNALSPPPPSSSSSSSHRSTLRYLDLSLIPSVTQLSLSYSPSSLLDASTLPLEVIELGSDVLAEVKRRQGNIRSSSKAKPEWVVKELGRRGWYVRQPNLEGTVDDGWRPWKMGARWWGMRKVPVVEQDVGGMYGYFMFKRS
ncbi:Leucine Rich Repeat domain protein [Cladophialophora carrionii]|uniref:Leucine Rich Repeat domain protein n=1 Tax=Cladophialophora carrionii TaxID=86049 RepID=A0A1C1CXR7_9EURO|nr:Leucine Rich Repeat domain protein [Cladophialophora carrionii]